MIFFKKKTRRVKCTHLKQANKNLLFFLLALRAHVSIRAHDKMDRNCMKLREGDGATSIQSAENEWKKKGDQNENDTNDVRRFESERTMTLTVE